jgi:predicted acyl esterase
MIPRIPLVASARRFTVGHRLRLVLASDDQPEDVPAIMGFFCQSCRTERLRCWRRWCSLTITTPG